MFQKKKLLITLAIVCASVVGLFVVGRLTGALTYFSFGPGSNIPAIKPGDYCFTSNLITPKRYDFIAFNYIHPELGKQTWSFRLCGMPGDKLELKNGNLYINDHSADDSLNLNLIYTIPADKAALAVEHLHLKDDEVFLTEKKDKAIVYMSKDQARELAAMQVPVERHLLFKGQAVPEIEAIFHHPWTIDDFGPVQVPANHYFVLGDNRYFAQDSRFIGFIEKSQLYGVVLGVK